jgi:hypothetical protein
MSIGPLGFFGSIAASPAAQRGADAERAGDDAVRQQGEIKNDSRAEKAGGIGETDGDEHATDERDADGRRPWEVHSTVSKQDNSIADTAAGIRQSKDASGTSGAQLDLTG